MAKRLGRPELDRVRQALMATGEWALPASRVALAERVLADVPNHERLLGRTDLSGSPEYTAYALLSGLERAGNYAPGKSYLSAFLRSLAREVLNIDDVSFFHALADGMDDSPPPGDGEPAAAKDPGIPQAAELAQRLERRLTRAELAVLWYQLFGNLISDDIPSAALSESAIQLVSLAEKRGKAQELVALIRSRFPHVLSLPL